MLPIELIRPAILLKVPSAGPHLGDVVEACVVGAIRQCQRATQCVGSGGDIRSIGTEARRGIARGEIGGNVVAIHRDTAAAIGSAVAAVPKLPLPPAPWFSTAIRPAASVKAFDAVVSAVPNVAVTVCEPSV